MSLCHMAVEAMDDLWFRFGFCRRQNFEVCAAACGASRVQGLGGRRRQHERFNP